MRQTSDTSDTKMKQTGLERHAKVTKVICVSGSIPEWSIFETKTNWKETQK